MAECPQLENLAKRFLVPLKKNLSILFCRFDIFQIEKLLGEGEAICLLLPLPTFPAWEGAIS